jgi:hypothetical protein
MLTNQPIQEAVAGRKTCLQCGKPVRGRVDKKFCDDYCRNSYNNKLKGISSNLVRNINNALNKNRRILQNLIEENGSNSPKANKEMLEQLGFQFKYLTHVHRTRNGKTYHYCYDHAYVPIDKEWYLVVKKEE